MKRFIYAIIVALTLISCGKEKHVNKEAEIINSYAGEYSILMMDWQAYGVRGVSAVDLDGDGTGSNELIVEMLNLSDYRFWANSRFIPNEDGKTATLQLMIPVMDYYRSDDYPNGILPTFSVNPACFNLNVSINEDCTNIVSNKFDHLEWPDEERISLCTFGGVQISEAYSMYQRIYLTVDHYQVYDFFTSKLMDGALKIWLSKE